MRWSAKADSTCEFVNCRKGPSQSHWVAVSAASALKKNETVGDVFRRFDKDGGGTLDMSELRAALTDLKLPLDSPAAAAALAQLQASGASGLTMAEFRLLVKELKKLGR